MTNVVVGKKRTIHVSTNATAGVIDTSVPVTIKNSPIVIGATATSLDQLTDVNISERVDGATLVYDSGTNTYIVKLLDFSDLTGVIDGGIF